MRDLAEQCDASPHLHSMQIAKADPAGEQTRHRDRPVTGTHVAKAKLPAAAVGERYCASQRYA